jgi:vancomycin permeability regulator SanA
MFCACQTREEQPSMSRDKIAAVVGDLFIADAAIVKGYGGFRDTMQAYYYNQVFDIHGITREQLHQELALYSRNFSEMDTIIKMAEERLKVKAE